MARGSDGRGGGRLALLIVALAVVLAAVAWLWFASNRTAPAVPDLDVRVPAPDVVPDVLPDRTPTTPPAPLPIPSG